MIGYYLEKSQSCGLPASHRPHSLLCGPPKAWDSPSTQAEIVLRLSVTPVLWNPHFSDLMWPVNICLSWPLLRMLYLLDFQDSTFGLVFFLSYWLLLQNPFFLVFLYLISFSLFKSHLLMEVFQPPSTTILLSPRFIFPPKCLFCLHYRHALLTWSIRISLNKPDFVGLCW